MAIAILFQPATAPVSSSELTVTSLSKCSAKYFTWHYIGIVLKRRKRREHGKEMREQNSIRQNEMLLKKWRAFANLKITPRDTVF